MPMSNINKLKKIEIPLTNKELSLDSLIQLIENNMIEDELPFDLLFEQYPSLLSRWYPGYPLEPRMMTDKDPIRCRGNIKNKMLTIPEFNNSEFPLDENCKLEGKYDVWLVKNDNNEFFVHIVEDE